MNIKIGKWSEISLKIMPDLGEGSMFENILSMSVADVAVTRVGLSTKGRIKWDVIKSIKDWQLELFEFNKLMLISPEMIQDLFWGAIREQIVWKLFMNSL